jgi:DNA-binding NarL/FixJ family response regulator
MRPQGAAIRLLMVDDHEIVRAGMKQFLAGADDIVVAGEAGSGTEAIEKARSEDWDVVLLDISMPDQNGVDILRQIKHVKPDLPVLILSMFPEDQYAINLLRAGASGYLTKDGPHEQLLAAIRTAADGRKYISPSLAEKLATDLTGDSDKPLHAHLSEREFQVFRKLAAGVSVSKIGDELCLSVKTISTHRARIMEKMGMKTNADLTYYAIKNNLIE